MRAFRFRLQSLLDLNERRRELAARATAVAEAGLRAIEHELSGLALRRRHTGTDLTRAGRTTSVQALQQLDRELDSLDQGIRRATVNRRAQTEEVEKRRRELIARRQDEEKLERLRQRRHEAWQIAERRLAQAELDEVASQQRARRPQ